jgi:diadenosine tetraphosphate (Ap4A) HIT family hydrolase
VATSGFELDQRLEGDSLPVCDLPLCTVRLMRDARFPWLLLVPRRPGASEIIDLAEPDRDALMREIALASQALRDSVETCDKINVGSLGNMVPQLHVHVIARVVGDAAWPGPVWGSGIAEPWPRGKAEALARALASRLAAAG